MRTSTGALFAVTSVAIAAGVWSTLGTAAGLVGAYDPALREPTAAQQVMDRFPRASESFQPFGFVRPPEAMGARKHDRQPVMGAAPVAPGCRQGGWPFMGPECLPQAKPRAAERSVTTERRTATTSTLTRTTVAAAAAAPATASATTGTAVAGAPACKQNLAAVMARADKVMAQSKSQRGRAEACTTY